MPNFRGSPRMLQRVVALGTGAVSTQTVAVGRIPLKSRVKAIRAVGQGAVTGTSITAEVFARTTAGAAGNTLQSAATDVKFASQAAARTGVAASLTATLANLDLAAGQLLEAVITASSVTAGPGDLVIEVELEPRG